MQCNLRAGLGVLILTFLTALSIPAQNIITTVAGSEWIFRGDGSPALSAPLGQLARNDVDADGNVFILDASNQVVAKITPAGLLTIVAGNGLSGYTADGGPATGARFYKASAVAMDRQGNVYIAEFHRIRKVNASGIISTLAGTSQYGFWGDGGPATLALLNQPSGLAVDAAGNVYVSDTANQRVRRISTAGTIETVAGNGSAAFSGDGGLATAASLRMPSGITVNAAGALYIVDQGNRVIRKVGPNGVITTIAGGGNSAPGDGGPATNAYLDTPFDVAVDSLGNVYFTDGNTDTVRKVNPSGIISTVAGIYRNRGYSGDGGPATAALLSIPVGVSVDNSGALYISEMLNYRVRKVTAGGTITTIAGSGAYKFQGDSGPAKSASLNHPTGVAVDTNRNLYIVDSNNYRIRKVDAAGTIATVAGNGTPSFSGDGGPATKASFNVPRDFATPLIALDPGGNLILADTYNHRIRRVTADGIIRTIAGTGAEGFSGDGGPATAAQLGNIYGVATDPTGSIYFSELYPRIRKISPSGTITTIAGSGQYGSSGDGGPATLATFQTLGGLTVSASGEVYVTDPTSGRIRKITTDGKIVTVAGGGSPEALGDGGPATAAFLSYPTDVKLDAAGNLYIADSYHGWIRRVGLDGTISRVAGSWPYASPSATPRFSGDGGPATAALLNDPSALVFDAAGNLYIADAWNDRVRCILAGSPAFSASPSSLSFAGTAGLVVAGEKSIVLSSSTAGLAWQAAARTSSGGAWLKLSSASDVLPTTLSVSSDATSLAAGVYQGMIAISVPGAVPSSVSVAVTLTVAAAQPPSLGVQPLNLEFRMAAGGSSPPAQSLRVENMGGGTLNWTAQASAATGNWLSITPPSGTASAVSAETVAVGVNHSGLAAGSYSETITVRSADTNQTVTVPVRLLLTPPGGVLLLSQTAMLFRAVQRAGAEPEQTVGVLNIGSGSLDWSAQPSASWLRVTPSSGRSDAGSSRIPLVSVSIEPTGLTAGFYTGTVRVTSGGANNSPQVVKVDLQVLPPGTRLGAVVRPTGLIFIGVAGTSSPGSQEVRVSTTETGTIEYQSLPIGGDWVTRAPDRATATASQSGRIVVQPELGNLAAGAYRAGLTVMTLNDGELYPVRLLMLVLPAGSSIAGRMTGTEITRKEIFGEYAGPSADSSCAASKLVLQFASVFSSFNAVTGWPSTILVNARDDCGNPAAGGNVVLSFSSGDPPLVLTDLNNGVYHGAWRPGGSHPQVVITARGTWRSLTGEAQATAQVGSNPNAQGATLSQGGVLLGAGFQRGPIAPGSIISLFGQKFTADANTSHSASALPLSTKLGTVRVLVGDRPASLFYVGHNQVNAQVPTELSADRQLQVLVETDGVPSAPEPLLTTASSPGIFTLGSGQQGAILIANTNALAAPEGSVAGRNARPVERGGYISIYCTGLGATDPAVASGAAGPAAEPLARVKTPVTVTIGDQTATPVFAGLAPGFVAVYQVDVQVPAGVAPGNTVPIVITQAGARSNTATVAVR